MKVHTATFVASALSGLVLVLSLLAIGCIYNNVHNIWNELDKEMDEFRVITLQSFICDVIYNYNDTDNSLILIILIE